VGYYGQYVAAGSYLNDAKVQNFEMSTGEISDPVVNVIQAAVAMSTRNRQFGYTNSTLQETDPFFQLTLFFSAVARSGPQWSYDAGSPQRQIQTGTVLVSGDGSTIFFSFLETAMERARIVWYSALPNSDGTLKGSYVSQREQYLRAIAVNHNGTIFVGNFHGLLIVINTVTNQELFRFNTAVSVGFICISPDARFISYGFYQQNLWEWNGATYVQILSYSIPDFVSVGCGIGGGNGDLYHLAILYGAYTWNQVKVAQWSFDHRITLPPRVYTGDQSFGQLQDLPTDLSMSADGNYFGVSSWGNEERTSPQCRLFDRSGFIYGEDTPGSMNAVSVFSSGSNVSISCAGKNVHANVFGNGGDIVGHVFQFLNTRYNREVQFDKMDRSPKPRNIPRYSKLIESKIKKKLQN